jgi:ribosomal protein L11 methylase PrmA
MRCFAGPFAPTNRKLVEIMLDTAKVGPDDFVIDLGSGDGRIVITAAKDYGAQGFGVDINPWCVREASKNAKAAGVDDRVQFFERNLFDTDFSRATVLTTYLRPDAMALLKPRLLAELKPGARIVSHDFDMGDDWPPDSEVGPFDCEMIYLWTIPAPARDRGAPGKVY